jgi:hypothetical protein
MGNLKGFIKYLDDRIDTIAGVEQRLCALQEKYESFYSEVARVRESELEQLTAHIVADRRALPDWFNQALDAAEAEVEQAFQEKLAALEQERSELEQAAEALRRSSISKEQAVRKKNVALDRQEEELKARSETLLAQIKAFNDEIGQLGRGFGFFANFFKMRGLARRRRALDREQADLAARIDALRARWATVEREHADTERELQREWIAKETEAAAVQAKLDHLQQLWPRIQLRSTVERVLFKLVPDAPAPQPNDPPCPRCRTPNPAASHFCRICAQRLGEDRPDFDGSVREIAEVNQHHARFSEGMKACQELIGLVKGLRSGLEAFMKSVRDVKHTEDRHNLATLRIDVPQGSVEYGRHFDALLQAVGKDLSLHPKIFAQQVEQLIQQVFTEAKIKGYFETMGEELSRQANSQW